MLLHRDWRFITPPWLCCSDKSSNTWELEWNWDYQLQRYTVKKCYQWGNKAGLSGNFLTTIRNSWHACYQAIQTKQIKISGNDSSKCDSQYFWVMNEVSCRRRRKTATSIYPTQNSSSNYCEHSKRRTPDSVVETHKKWYLLCEQWTQLSHTKIGGFKKSASIRYQDR